MLEAYTLASGSSGNALVVRSGRWAILIDAGRSRRAIAGALAQAGMALSEIAAVFITHEHSDHIAALPQLAKHEQLPIHAAACTAEVLLKDDRVASCVVAHPVCFTEQIGELRVTSFSLPHDSLCHVGYRIEDADGDALCVATDMGHVTDAVKNALCGCRGALLEANHDVEMLRYGAYPAYLKQRVLSPVGHLSNADCAALALYAAHAGVTNIALGHLSAENNTPETARCAVARALDGSGVTLTVCARDALTRIL